MELTRPATSPRPVAIDLAMPSTPKPRYRRVILKISGESFAKPGQFGIDPQELGLIAKEIHDATICGSQVAVVVGGGNIVRGAALAQQGVVNQSTADYMGMLGTVINGLALKEALAGLGQESRLMSAIPKATPRARSAPPPPAAWTPTSICSRAAAPAW
jgi:uridylate kinase